MFPNNSTKTQSEPKLNSILTKLNQTRNQLREMPLHDEFMAEFVTLIKNSDYSTGLDDESFCPNLELFVNSGNVGVSLDEYFLIEDARLLI